MMVILVLMLGLFLPVQIVKSVIDERKNRQDEVYAQMSAGWGSPVLFGGIYLMSGNKRIIANSADIVCDTKVETRSKGIFRVPCFTTQIRVSADFDTHEKSEDYGLGLSLSYTGLIEIVSLQINDAPSAVEKQKIKSAVFSQNRDIAKINAKTKKTRCTLVLKLRGSGNLDFANQAGTTAVAMNSDWANPNFTGLLPSSREIHDSGFSAQWNSQSDSLYLSEDELEKIGSETFGVSFFVPQSMYQKTDRVLKYALLFIFLTFALFFTFEHVYNLRIHPMQYLLVGAALTIFYLLLLSLSEHIAFGISYLTAAFAVIAMISMYCVSVLKEKFRAVLIALFLVALYSFLYILLQMQEYSLLLGAAGVFVLLAAAMFFTRNIDWYALHEHPES